ncbi:disease resistance protein RUN1-like [Eucalyptus grandis]|uniref:disease resistance protein RUN1-like n=1 Tax=Eucalyptus grandis TaxID=71139 RepID=UPI00192E8F1D|nr:disease resistance protein RUN1-like [Eucalyptus grandis]XP_039157758.1 disease resistance protein RUN1-like [Eucalyptus grandis]XP_039157759.1 disease resistance protein RUN1-like [Eucalyptus grandis]XP_039157760.1 disease resistance protein RUN1-like [Eucalyptus grandis]
MANSEIGTSTCNTLGGEYQVFLSFRGLDTRRGFTNSLYHALVDTGVRVFFDDEELRPGETISDNLLQAIDNSKLYIPIFSENYASSHWCLCELAKMVENTSKSKEDGKKKFILPIFYDVKPNDVKLKTTLYSEAISNMEQKMENQKKKFSYEDIETWRQALKEIDGTKGWELEKYSGYGDLIKLVVNEVVVRLKTRERQVTEDLVGIDDRIAAVNNLLDINSGGVRLIGIYGMGGIGKTTLAKIIFNQLCPHFGKNCSFLDDVRETAKTKGLVKLQEQLLSDISYSRVTQGIDNIDCGINTIGETICNKKVLIVLDDIDEGNQIQKLIEVNSLYPGTRILVTTRDKNVLKIRRFKYEILTYEMEGLSKKDALQLFSRHAFNGSSPPNNYYTLSEGIVSITGRLPLALEAIGSLLFGQEEKTIWEEMLGKLRETPTGDVLGKLRISYDALDSDQQQIFLDVACFCIGQKKIDPLYVWKDRGFMADYAIHILIDRCMIKVLDDNSLWMHDQFRDLGRTIVNQENLQYPGKRTRLWVRDDIICELRSTEIKGSVQALCLQAESGKPIIVTAEQMKRFTHLQFLWLSNVICEGDLSGCLSKLKWIILHRSASSAWDSYLNQWKHLGLENVVVMNLSFLDFDHFSYLIKGATKLKVLTLQCMLSINRTPTFPEYSVLEKLTISECPFLMEIDCSIKQLRCLTDLSVESCSAFQNLPEQIGGLQNLRHLSLRKCGSLSKLPGSVSKLESLAKLDVSHGSITRSPDSIGILQSVSYAHVSHTPIAEMPSTMSKFLHLQTLDLEDCHGIEELPELPRSLTTLRLISISLLIVPNLSYLTNLVELHLSNGSEGMATSKLIQSCDLPWIGRLSKVHKLHFCLWNVCAPTTELGSLSLLKELALYGLDLQKLKQLPSNLMVLELRNTRVKQVHVNGLLSVEKETVFVSSSLKKLREKVFKQLDIQSVDVFELSERSCIRDCKSSERLACLPEVPGFNELQAPELTDRCRGANLVLNSLKMLQEFHMGFCPDVQDIHFVSTLESLGVFTVEECVSLKRSMERIFDASSSKIPNECRIKIEYCGKLLDTHFVTWESYRRKILNGTIQASDSNIETTDSTIEMGDPLQKTKEGKLKRGTDGLSQFQIRI